MTAAAGSRSGSAFDAPEAVTRVAVLDGMPDVEALERCDARFAARWWHWFFFAQTEKPAERVDRARPRGVVPAPTREPMGAENHADWTRARSATRRRCTRWWRTTAPGSGSTASTRRPTAPRAGASPARCCSPARSHDDMEELYGDPVAIWRDWADDVRGARIDSGHHMAEEAPEAARRRARRSSSMSDAARGAAQGARAPAAAAGDRPARPPRAGAGERAGGGARRADAGALEPPAAAARGRARARPRARAARSSTRSATRARAAAAAAGPPRRRPPRRSAARAPSRTCYDHLAGPLGVALYRDLVRARRAGRRRATAPWRSAARPRRVRRARRRRRRVEPGRRRLAFECLDATEQRPHLAGALGGAWPPRCRNAAGSSAPAGARSGSPRPERAPARASRRSRRVATISPPTPQAAITARSPQAKPRARRGRRRSSP